MTFGGLMMVVGAFQQVQSALRWFVDNLSRIADWRATLLRVVTLREALVALGRDDGTDRIALGEHATGGLAFDHLVLAVPDGKAVLGDARLEVGPGEHLMIEAEQAADQDALLRAVAGLWPQGTGAIRRPPAAHATFLPERPYFPLGSLRAALAYPRDPAGMGEEELRETLARVGLGHLAGSLDREERWDKSLALEEQQRLALARLLLQRPRWVFLEDATAAMGEEQRRLMVSIFCRDLAGATVVGIGRGTALGGFYARTVRLHRLRAGALPYHRPRPYLMVQGGKVAQAGAF
jgi:putative ATP-binding cassette transporter